MLWRCKYDYINIKSLSYNLRRLAITNYYYYKKAYGKRNLLVGRSQDTCPLKQQTTNNFEPSHV